MEDVIQYRGSYRYADRTALEVALARARTELAEDEVDAGWLRFFVSHGTELTVNISVPSDPELRFAAANVFLTLAAGAVEGAVVACQAGRAVDVF
jgi:hypothetical protein